MYGCQVSGIKCEEDLYGLVQETQKYDTWFDDCCEPADYFYACKDESA